MDKNYEILDLLNVASFIIGILNYEENLTQGDKQDLMSVMDKTTKTVLNEINAHLVEQDRKLDLLMEVINDNKRNNN